jgi:hypothetical protein
MTDAAGHNGNHEYALGKIHLFWEGSLDFEREKAKI